MQWIIDESQPTQDGILESVGPKVYYAKDLPDGLDEPGRLAWIQSAILVAAPFSRQPDFPALLTGANDLEQSETWKLILRFCARNIPALARFTMEAEIAPDGLIEALGWKAHYRSLEEWKEWANLDESSEALFMEHDLPLNVLRLWNRLPKSERATWTELFHSRNVRKNLVREIVQYYHDLSPEDRSRALEQCVEFSENWKARSGSFPAEQFRDILFAIRNPEFSELRDSVFELQKRLPSHRKIQYIIPEHLESGFLDVRLRIERPEDLGEIIEALKTMGTELPELLKLL